MMKKTFRNSSLYAIIAILVIQLAMPMRAFADPGDVVDNGYDPYFYSANDILYYDPRATTCGISSIGSVGDGEILSSDVEKSFTLGTDNTMRAVNLANQMKADFSLTDAQAAGIVGNFMHESGGAHLPPDVNEGGTAAPPKFSGGYGWAQWTGGRQKLFIDFAISKGYMASTSVHANDAANYAFLKYELIKTERSTLPAVGRTSTPAEAATAFEANFERAGVPALEKRIRYANILFKALKDGTGIDVNASIPAPSETSEAACSAGTGIPAGGRVFDTVVFPLGIKKSEIKNNGMFRNGTAARGGHPYIAFDILAPAGSPVVALTSGRVTMNRTTGAMGGMIVIYNEEKKIHVFYTHMTPKNSLKIGDQVTPGTPLGALVSVRQFPSINADHLHIDAGTGDNRLACSRENSNGPACNTRVDIGPDLFNAWEKLSP